MAKIAHDDREHFGLACGENRSERRKESVLTNDIVNQRQKMKHLCSLGPEDAETDDEDDPREDDA